MSRIRSLLMGLLLMAATAPLAAQQPDLPMPSFASRYVVLFSMTAAPEGPTTQRIMHEHVQYQLRLQQDGVATAGGPFSEGADTSLVGMTVLKVASLAEARRIVEADPAVRQGRFTVRIVQWLTPEGRLP